MIGDLFRFSVSAFKKQKPRTRLTLIGVFLGIMLLIILVILTQGLQGLITEEFQTLGMDKIIITPGTDILTTQMYGLGINHRDINAVRKVPGVRLVACIIYKLAQVKYEGETAYVWVTGLALDEARRVFETFRDIRIAQGRNLKQDDEAKAVIGIDLTEKEKIFLQAIKIGDRIMIENKEFEVIGSLERRGNPDDDSSILIPLADSREAFNQPYVYDMLIAQVSPGLSADKIAEEVKIALRKSRDVEEGEEDFTLQTSGQFIERFNSIVKIIQIVLLSLAAISLLIGSIGIMNTMYAAVLERTNEIGVMMAVGAKRWQIAFIFLVESGLLGFGGGIIGIILGIAISKAVEAFIHLLGMTMFVVQFPPDLLTGALLFAVIVGIISGLLPALRAARLNPAEVLRYE